MACPITDPTPSERLISFCSNYSLNGPYSGSFEIADCNCEYDTTCGDVCDPVEIGIDNLGLDINCCTPDDSADLEYLNQCYEENPLWLAGLARTFGRNIEAGTVSASVSSYFDYLNSKPINTQQFDGAYLSDVFNTIFTYYTGTPPNLYCLNSFEDSKIKGPVEGNSSYAELFALAQAGCANLFVQVGGCLTIEKWKDHTDPTEFIIPDEMLISANPSDYKFPNTSAIRVRGASLSKWECGEQTISNDHEGNQGSIRKCTIAGIPTQCASITFNNLRGEKNDILAARIYSSDTCYFGDKKNVGDGTFGIEVFNVSDHPLCRATNGAVDCDAIYAQLDAGNTSCIRSYSIEPTCTDFLVTTTFQSVFDESLYGYYHGPGYGGGWGSNTRNFGNIWMNWLKGSFPVPYSMFGFGAFGSSNFFSSTTGGTNDNRSFSDQPSYQQIETVVTVPGISSCGISIEEISNKYIPCKEQLFKMAVRRFQELKMAANSWDVEVAYMPCIKLNQMVEFTVPKTEGCEEQVIKGIVGGINVCADQDNGISMKLSIADVSCLGQTSYTSSNLINSFCAGAESSDLNPWLTSELGIDQISSNNSGCLILFASGDGHAYLNYVHSEMTIGDEYSWSFDYQRFSGLAPVLHTFPTSAGQGGGSLGGPSGTKSGTFNALTTSATWTWDLLTPISPTYYKISNFVITKTVIG